MIGVAWVAEALGHDAEPLGLADAEAAQTVVVYLLLGASSNPPIRSYSRHGSDSLAGVALYQPPYHLTHAHCLCPMDAIRIGSSARKFHASLHAWTMAS